MLDWQLKAEHHARDAFPSEVCGLVLCIKGKEKYWVEICIKFGRKLKTPFFILNSSLVKSDTLVKT